MALKTKRDLATRVLRKLRIASSVQAPAAEDVARVAGAYDTKLEEWRDRDLVYWTNTDLATAEIPIAAFDALVDLMINEVGGDYGRDQLGPIERRQIEERLLQHLRRHTQTRSSGLPTHADYF